MPRTRAHRSGWKPSSAARGYGAAHVAERKRWVPIVQAGGVACAKCGQPIIPGMPWDLGHTADRTTWTGPEHRRCNRRDGARRGNKMRVVRGLRTVWQKACVQCQQPFTTVFSRQLTCGKACAEARRKARPIRLVKGEQIPARVCAVCSHLFVSAKASRKTCGGDCSRAWSATLYHRDDAYRAKVLAKSKAEHASRVW